MPSRPNTVMLYTDPGKCGQNVWNLVQRQGTQGLVEFFNAFENLKARLNQVRHDHVIAVLILFDRLELAHVVRFADVLHEVKTILVLPDREPDTIAIGHSLYPRFISYADGDLLDVAAVLEKMLGQPHDQPA